MGVLTLVAGDVINQNMTGITVWQPAATVEIMVLTVFIDNNGGRFGLTNGVVNTYQYTSNFNAVNTTLGNVKIGITNSDYWTQTNGTGSTQGFSGIQIK